MKQQTHPAERVDVGIDPYKRLPKRRVTQNIEIVGDDAHIVPNLYRRK